MAMRSQATRVTEGLVRVPCRHCGRSSAFVTEAGCCPFCRAEEIERENGLRPGLFRELVFRNTTAPKLPPRRAQPKRRRVAARV